MIEFFLKSNNIISTGLLEAKKQTKLRAITREKEYLHILALNLFTWL